MVCDYVVVVVVVVVVVGTLDKWLIFVLLMIFIASRAIAWAFSSAAVCIE